MTSAPITHEVVGDPIELASLDSWLGDCDPARIQGELQAVLARSKLMHSETIGYSLDRMWRLLSALGNPHQRLPPTIHVAGTNGKGSTIAYLRALLEASGHRVHVYTSPHLLRINERIRIATGAGGSLVPDSVLLDALLRCEAANRGQPITFFEFTTAAALLIFSEWPADILLLEVGMGGRLDATNVIPAPQVGVLTSISLDHQEFLGRTVRKIAEEKAGIIKRGSLIVCSRQLAGAERSIYRAAQDAGAQVFMAGRSFIFRRSGTSLHYKDAAGTLRLPLPPLAGRHQDGNLALAVAALRAADRLPDPGTISSGLRRVQWPGRMQRLVGGPIEDFLGRGSEIWVDGAHNPDAALAAACAMAAMGDHDPRPLFLVAGLLVRKDATGFLKAFARLRPTLVGIDFRGPEPTYPSDEIARRGAALGLEAMSAESIGLSLAAIRERMRETGTPARVLYTGSLYLAADVLKYDCKTIR